VVVVGRDAIGSVATDGCHDQEQPQHHPFSHRLPLQWQARPDGVASMAASSPPPSLWKMTTGGTAATRGGGGTADTSKCHRRATTAKNIHHAPLPPAGPSTLLPSNSLGGRSATGMTSDPLVEAAYKMTALGSTAACVHRRLSSSSQASSCQCCLDALCGGGFSLRRRCLVHLHRRKEQKGGRRLNSRRPLFPFFLSRHHREQPMFISSPRVHVLLFFVLFFPPCV
jgi:hypothetical protein